MKHLATIQIEYMKLAEGMEWRPPTTAGVEDKEAQPKNPWAICTSAVGRDSDKYEHCVKDVKKQM